MNRNGQIGSILSAASVSILIIIIMAAFVFLSAGFSAVKGEKTEAVINAPDADLMLKIVEIEADGEVEKAWVLDEFARLKSTEGYFRKGYFMNALRDGLRPLLTEEKDCLFIFSGTKESPPEEQIFADYFMMRLEDGRVIDVAGGTGGPDLEDKYRQAGVIRSTSFVIELDEKERRIFTDYYHGKCLD